MKWRWFVLKREIRRIFVCRRKGHAFEWSKEYPRGIDAYWYRVRCERCHRHWPGFMITHSGLVSARNVVAMIRAEIETYERRIAEHEAGLRGAM